ncbi:hypothetical protein [Staphylococcus caeli]|uniref:Lipoprotein n=1 Tax=Staphylococcus caeli TaxID=2201815 RepID=A0A1D4L3B4_9STAP|nr:hypothetical protein [Staphylococcus caeli]SCS80542.1 lipoprotein [Staphylococcus caeli]SCS93913.1 lipoprotein [Staphylococcus caeli]
MKKLLAGVLTLSLALAACSNGSDDSSKKDDSSKDKQSSEDKSKDSKNNDKKSNDSSDKDKEKNSDSKSNDNNDSSSDGSDKASNNDANSGNTNGSNDSSNTNSANNGNDSAASNNNGNASGSMNSGNNDNATSNTSSNTGGSQYVAPYQGQNAVPVAQNITAGGTDTQSALQYLPNFQTALDNAAAEVNGLNGQTNPYNDYAIEGSSGAYSYIFSFQNQAQPGTYMIATVDQQGTVRVVDPAYQQ